jgi:CRP-like cAMP-binding protein
MESSTATALPVQTTALTGEAPRTPLAEIVDALRRVTALQGLADSELEWLATHGEEVAYPAGTPIFREGDPATKMWFILRGEAHVRRSQGGLPLFVGRAGQITGLLPFSRMKTHGGQGFAASDLWGVQIDREVFPEMLEAIPSMSQRCVSILLDRVREMTRLEQQTEKLNALGKLAGNLAHELNNPASAAQRAASGLIEELQTYGHQKFLLGSLCLDDAHLERIRAWRDRMEEQAQARPANSVTQAHREDHLQRWLREHGVESSWQIVPDLAELGITRENLDELAELLGNDHLEVVLSQFASSARTERMAQAMVDSTKRIFDLIGAVKDYSWMDQAPIQEVDIRQSLETTLTMLQSAGKGEDRAEVCGGSAAHLGVRERTESGVDGAAGKRAGCDAGCGEADAERAPFWRVSGDGDLGQRAGDSGRASGPDLRAVLLDEGSRERAGARPRYSAAHCATASGVHSRSIEAGGDVFPGPAAD